ncbi:MAG: polysaccharide biosynthesis tyrosine autokinase [Lysobacteraceae bacterium]|nr:MAG: polysaccharide biosynthesis tyrosine autokinase [Xanthomonadaceae bacterium]
MPQDHLPIGASSEEPRLPIHRSPEQGTLALRPAGMALDLFEEPKRNEDEIDLLAYWQILLKRRWLVLGILASILALTLLVTLLTPPLYRATSTLQIDRETMKIVQVEGMETEGTANSGDFYQTQYELLQSRALAERVVDTLNLASAATLDSFARHSWFDRMREALRPKTQAQTQKNANSVEAQHALRQAVGVVQEGLSIEPVRNSRLVKVHFDSGNPQFSAQVVNALSEGFIAQQLERRFDASSYAKTYLEDRLRQLKAKLADSERQLVAFAQKENIVNTGEGQSLVSQNLTELNAALAAAQAARIRAQARWNEASSGGALPADMMSDSIIRTLQQQRAELQGQYQQKLQVFKPDYPEMKQLEGQIASLDQEIRKEMGSIRASVKAEYDAAMAQEGLLNGKIAALRDATLDVDNRSIQYNILKREVDTNRQLYDAMLQRYKEIGVAGGVSTNNVSIVDRALPPSSRYKPNLPFNLAIGLLLGAILGVLTAFVLEFIDQTLKTPQDVEQKLRLSVLGIIPRLKRQEVPAQALRDLRSAFSEAYRSVRTALQFSTDSGVPKVLLVTSASPAEGKSTTAWSLARNFAQLGKSVLLIDGDLRNPSLHKVSEVRCETGLSNLLSGAANINEAVQDTDDPRLKVVLAGPLPPNPAELLAGSKLISLLTVAAESYDQVIIDGPPVIGIADAPILANVAAGTLMVVEAGKTRIQSAQIAVKRLLAARARIIGVVLSKYAADAHGYGYGYGDYGTYAYGSTPQLTKQR